MPLRLASFALNSRAVSFCAAPNSVVARVVSCSVKAIHHCQLRAATEAYLAQLKAQGEPLDLAQVIPPPVPPVKNSAPLITNALAQINRKYTNSIIYDNPPYAMSRAIPGRKMIGWRQPVIHSPDSFPSNLTNTWADLGAQLAERRDDLRDLRKLIENPTIDFNYDYSDPKNYSPALAVRFGQIKMAVQWLEISVFYNLHEDKTAEACNDARTLLAFVKAQANERFLISQLVRWAFAGIAADTTWNVLQASNISDANLAQLQHDWESLEFIVPLKNANLFERVSELRLVDHLRQTPTNLASQVAWTQFATFPDKENRYIRKADGTYVLDESIFRKVINGISTQWAKFQWRWFGSYTDEIRGVRMWRSVIDGTQILETNRSFGAVHSFLNTNFIQMGFDSVKDNPYALISHYAHHQLSAFKKLEQVETRRSVVIAAIALKRYEIRHHQFPATLADLTPDLLNSVPIDCMDGQPLRYRPNTDGTFLLYSVGENGKDDGGNPSLEKNFQSSSFHWQNSHALDWVWPQPATPEEIQNFYKLRPK